MYSIPKNELKHFFEMPDKNNVFVGKITVDNKLEIFEEAKEVLSVVNIEGMTFEYGVTEHNTPFIKMTFHDYTEIFFFIEDKYIVLGIMFGPDRFHSIIRAVDKLLYLWYFPEYKDTFYITRPERFDVYFISERISVINKLRIELLQSNLYIEKVVTKNSAVDFVVITNISGSMKINVTAGSCLVTDKTSFNVCTLEEAKRKFIKVNDNYLRGEAYEP